MPNESIANIRRAIFDSTPRSKTILTDKPILYHYTSADVFLKVLSEQRIRLSHVFYMNDFSEFSWISNEVIRPSIDKRQAEAHFEYWGLVLNLIYGGTPGTIPGPAIPGLPSRPFQHMDTYVFSLSDAGDDLGQWRAYAYGNGVAIGMSYEFLNSLAASCSGCMVQLGKCQYDPPNAHVIINDLLNRNFAPGQLSDDQDKKRIFGETQQFLNELVKISPFFKHPAYSSEEEWRLVVHRNAQDKAAPEVRFRAGGESIIPYIELELPDRSNQLQPILRVSLAPRLNSEWAMWSFSHFCRVSKYFPSIEFDVSKIPFRGAV